MQLRALTWEYVGNSDCLWRGRADGLLSHVSFTIMESATACEFVLQTDIAGIDQMTYQDLNVAKAEAQDILTSYAFSLIIF